MLQRPLRCSPFLLFANRQNKCGLDNILNTCAALLGCWSSCDNGKASQPRTQVVCGCWSIYLPFVGRPGTGTDISHTYLAEGEFLLLGHLTAVGKQPGVGVKCPVSFETHHGLVTWPTSTPWQAAYPAPASPTKSNAAGKAGVLTSTQA